MTLRDGAGVQVWAPHAASRCKAPATRAWQKGKTEHGDRAAHLSSGRSSFSRCTAFSWHRLTKGSTSSTMRSAVRRAHRRRSARISATALFPALVGALKTRLAPFSTPGWASASACAPHASHQPSHRPHAHDAAQTDRTTESHCRTAPQDPTEPSHLPVVEAVGEAGRPECLHDLGRDVVAQPQALIIDRLHRSRSCWRSATALLLRMAAHAQPVPACMQSITWHWAETRACCVSMHRMACRLTAGCCRTGSPCTLRRLRARAVQAPSWPGGRALPAPPPPPRSRMRRPPRP